MAMDDDGSPPWGAGCEDLREDAHSTTGSAAGGPPPPEGEERRYAPYTKYTAAVAREICIRVAAGEKQGDICAEDRMPTIDTLRRWARKRGAFGRALALARAYGGREGTGPSSGYNPAIASEITARLSEGETLTSIGLDPAMPSARTILNWRRLHPEFADDVRLAREVVAERFSDLGWKLAMEATPETAYLTHVRLTQLRWTARLMAPHTHGPTKAMDPPDPPEPPRETHISIRRFALETNPDNPNQHRVVGWSPNSTTLRPERDCVGPWEDKVDPAKKAADLEASWRQRKASAAAIQNAPDDPEGWR